MMYLHIIQGYRQNNAYVTTQGPLENTVNEFWRMVWEIKSRTIVMLCGLMENEMVQNIPLTYLYMHLALFIT